MAAAPSLSREPRAAPRRCGGAPGPGALTPGRWPWPACGTPARGALGRAEVEEVATAAPPKALFWESSVLDHRVGPRGQLGDPFSGLGLGRVIHFLLGFWIFSLGLSLRITNWDNIVLWVGRPSRGRWPASGLPRAGRARPRRRTTARPPTTLGRAFHVHRVGPRGQLGDPFSLLGSVWGLSISFFSRWPQSATAAPWGGASGRGHVSRAHFAGKFPERPAPSPPLAPRAPPALPKVGDPRSPILSQVRNPKGKPNRKYPKSPRES